MKLMLSTAAAVTALGLAAGSASAQNAVLVPHRGHYHVVPSYSPPVYSGYAYPAYSPGVTIGSAYSPASASAGSTRRRASGTEAGFTRRRPSSAAPVTGGVGITTTITTGTIITTTGRQS
jgi:hypothetical protein